MFTNQPLGPVLIIGAGVCGLTIAQGLRNANIPFRIFESGDDSELSSMNRAVTLDRSLSLLRALLPKDVADRLETTVVVDGSLHCDQHQNNAITIFDGCSGDLINEVFAKDRSLRVDETKLRAVCFESIEVKVCA